MDGAGHVIHCPDPVVFGPGPYRGELPPVPERRAAARGADLEAELEAAELEAEAEQAAADAEGVIHISVKCRVYSQYGRKHDPCAGTCDGHGTGRPCGERCACNCHR